MAKDRTEQIRTDHTQQLPRTVAVRQTKRIVVGTVGGIVLALGLVLLVTPGPGLVVVALGLTILSWEFRWARRLLVRVRARIRQMKSRAAGRKR